MRIIRQLHNAAFGLKILLPAPVSSLRFVLNSNRPLNASADLREILCTKPADSVQAATSRLRPRVKDSRVHPSLNGTTTMWPANMPLLERNIAELPAMQAILNAIETKSDMPLLERNIAELPAMQAILNAIETKRLAWPLSWIGANGCRILDPRQWYLNDLMCGKEIKVESYP